MPAIAATAYTVATVNNSFEGNLMGMIGFLDSPVSLDYFPNRPFGLVHVFCPQHFPDDEIPS